MLNRDIALRTMSGTIFVDGSGKLRRYLPSATRCGWATVQMSGESLVGAMYGNLEGREQTVPRAELMAIVRTLEIALLPVVIYCDHKNHVDAIAKGRAFCTRL